jgi:nicotinamide-nucleotide amidase
VKRLKPLVLVFGTSADPFHQGHTDLICDSVKALVKHGIQVKEVVLVPVFRHHNIQDNVKKSLPLTYEERYAMCQIAARQISNELGNLLKEVRVSRIEEQLTRENNRPNFSAETMQALRLETDSSLDLGFLLGLDAFAGPDPSFGHWYKLENLLESSALVIAPREGFKANEDFICNLESRGARLIFLESVKAREVSSTAIRSRLAQGERPLNLVEDGSLSAEILQYIQAHDLVAIWRALDAEQLDLEILRAPDRKDSLEVRIGKLLFERKLSLATAESCTGGLISHRLTNVPGSSEYFVGGVVSYAYEAKVRLLGVSWETLKAHGAVSAPVVLEMARGVRNLLSTDLGLSVSCIAGPGGATANKPVGYSWIGFSTPEGDFSFEVQLQGDRVQNKEALAEKALQVLVNYLEGQFN